MANKITKELLIKENLTVCFLCSYKNTLTYKGSFNDVEYLLHVYDYRYDFEKNEQVSDLFTLTESCKLKILDKGD